MAEFVIQPSFGAGEISPSLYARVDLAKYKVGAASLRNFFTDYRGGASNRPGTQYIDTYSGLTGQPRLIPFIYSSTITYVFVFVYVGGGCAVDIYSNGVFVVTLTGLPYGAADLPLLKYTQNNNAMTLTHPNYPDANIVRTSPTAFTYSVNTVGSTVQPPTGLNGTTDSAHSDGVSSYVVTSVSPDGKEESIPCFRADIVGTFIAAHPGTTLNGRLLWTPPSTPVGYYKIYSAGQVINRGSGGAAAVNTVFGYIGQSIGAAFFDDGIAPDFSQTPPQLQDPFSPGQISSVIVATGGSGYGGVFTAPLVFTGGGGTGAAGYAVIDLTTNLPVGVVMTDFGQGYTSAPTVTDSVGSATYTCEIGATSGTYPSAVTYFQQRRIYGGTPNFPDSLVCSQPGEYDNFNTSAISEASDAITVSLTSSQNNEIKSMVSMPTGLITFTSGGAFLVTGGSQTGAISPSTVVALPQASSGANDLPPLVVNYDVLYGQNRGAVVRDLAFNFYVQSYSGTDRSVLASHLFLNYTLDEWCYAEEPFRQIQVVRSDGRLLSFTYVPEQEVFAWSPWDTNGLFISICSVPEGQVNAVYVITQRYIQATATWTYFLERFMERTECCELTPWFVDCGLASAGTFPDSTLLVSESAGNVTITPGGGTVITEDLPVMWANRLTNQGFLGGSFVSYSDVFASGTTGEYATSAALAAAATVVNTGCFQVCMNYSSAPTPTISANSGDTIFLWDGTLFVFGTEFFLSGSDGLYYVWCRYDDFFSGPVEYTPGQPLALSVLFCVDGSGHLTLGTAVNGGAYATTTTSGSESTIPSNPTAIAGPYRNFSGYDSIGFYTGTAPQCYPPGGSGTLPIATGQVISTGCTLIEVTSVTGGTATGVVINGPLPVVPNDPFNTVLPLVPGSWELFTPTATFSGLDYLDGMYVTGVADGLVVSPRIVSGGSVILDRPASVVILGLGYQSQLQTLKLDVGEPTVQGKRKQISAVTARLNCTRGLKAGPDFGSLTDMKDTFPNTSLPAKFFSGDIRTTIQSVWKEDGQLCFQQDYPLPVSILGVIPEVTLGDTQR